MSRVALMIAMLAAPLVALAQPTDDMVLAMAPKAVRDACQAVFSGYRALRLVTKNTPQGPTYRVTVFNPAVKGARGGKAGDNYFSEMLLYDIELRPDGTIVEEDRHPVAMDTDAVPLPVMKSFQEWNPRGASGPAPWWFVERQRGKDPFYSANISVSAVQDYAATFKADGTIVSTASRPLR